MSDSEEAPRRPNTHTGNDKKRPGLLPGVKQVRRTPAEMAAFREAKKQEKLQIIEKRTAGIKAVADLENRSRNNVNKTNQQRNHPEDTLAIPRKARTRKIVLDEDG